MTSRFGSQPISAAKPRPMKPRIAVTMRMANQNSNSPFLATLSRLVPASEALDCFIELGVQTAQGLSQHPIHAMTELFEADY